MQILRELSIGGIVSRLAAVLLYAAVQGALLAALARLLGDRRWKVVGDCMIDAKIFHGDIILVDRSVMPKHRSIVLAVIDGEPTVKRFGRRNGITTLSNENRTLPPFMLRDGADVSIWGCVNWTLRDLRK